MPELIHGLATLSRWEMLTDVHGLLSVLSLPLLGAAIALAILLKKGAWAARPLKKVLLWLALDLALLDVLGLIVYAPYRAKDGPRSQLLASDQTAWLHTIVFEHKEFLAYAPWLMILGVALVVQALDYRLNGHHYRTYRKTVTFGIITACVYVFIVAAEAVLVTKAAPLK